MIRLAGYLPSSFVDWTGHFCSVLFVSGCNFNCPWCHNARVARDEAGLLDAGTVLANAAARDVFLDGIAVSGGEPTCDPGLVPFLAEIRNRTGFSVKIDTNGSHPERIRHLLEEGLVQGVAVDVKAPLDPASYGRLTGGFEDVGRIERTIRIVRELAPEYELRTTWVPDLLSLDDLRTVRRELDDDPNWVLQCYRPDPGGDAAGSFRSFERASPEPLHEAFPGIRVRA